MTETGPGEPVPTEDETPRDGTIDVIEVASAMLVRNFELLRRRGGVNEELDRAEYLLLRTLDRIGPSDICTLAKALGLDPSTAGRQVSALQGKDMVERSHAETDRRRSIISPTGTGRAQMASARDRRRETTRELLADWDEDDLRTLGDMFTRYNRSVAERYLTKHAPATGAAEALLPPSPES